MKKKENIVKELLSWYKANGRKFLWRNSKINLYKLLICEIFLWRTQANTVASFIDSFLNKYPSPAKIDITPFNLLAKDIIKLGLVNRRTKQLKQTFLNYNNKKIPRSEKEFRKRFKVGQYIARSVLTIYYKQDLFPVDQNIHRFIQRVFDYKIKNIRNISERDDLFLTGFINQGKRKIIWAIIDFSASICKKLKPRCNACILNKYCCYFIQNLNVTRE